MTVQLALDGSETVPEPVIRKGYCGCGCGEQVSGRSLYVNPAHRQCEYRKRVKREMEHAGLPAAPSLRVARMSRGTSEDNGDAQMGQNGSQRSRSGVQISYHKAFKALTSETDLYDEQIERALKSALPERQRVLLEEREAA